MADIEGIMTALGEGAIDAMSRAATDEAAEVAMTDAFSGVRDFDPAGIRISTDPDTGIRSIGRGEFKISLSDMQADLDGDISGDGKPPELKNVLEVLSKDFDINSDDFKTINDEKIGQFDNSKGKQASDALDERKREGKSAADAAGLPPDNATNAEMKELMDKFSENKAQFDELKEKFDQIKEDAKNGKKSWGEWTKDKLTDAAKLAAMGLGSYAFYEMVKKHQDAMNGCWMVEISTGKKCKVSQLTCDADARQAGINSNTACVSCKDCVTNKTAFNPCPGVECKGKEKTLYPGTGCDNCCSAKDGTTAELCLSDVPSCTDGCDSNCSSKYRNIPQGYSMKCVSVDWWGALSDGFGGLGGDISGLLKTILKWLIIGLAILLGIVILVYGVKFAVRKITG
jgi:hypothetical protein